MLVALQQEEIMNVFHDDWSDLGTGLEDDWSGEDCAELMLYQSFTDQKYSKDRKISCINWHPTIYGKSTNPTQAKWTFSRTKYSLLSILQKNPE